MKILFVLDSLGTGGAERSTANLWYYLREHNVSVAIVALRHRNEGIEKEIIASGFSVNFIRSKFFLTQVIEIARIIKSEKPNLVHSVLIKSNLRTRFAKLLTRFIHIESLVNCTYDPVRFNDPRVNRFALRLIKFIDRSTHSLTNQFIAITEVVKQHYLEQLRIPESKIIVIYRGRNHNQYVKDRESWKGHYIKELNLQSNARIIIHVGRQEFQKGHLTLLAAIKNLPINSNDPLCFIFLGREGNNTSDITKFLDENDLHHNILWLGHRYDVEKLLAISDIFVFPSLYEGLGGALIEAQAAGLPIVCSDIPVFHEVVAKDVNALMFSPTDPIELANNLQELLRNKDMAEQMGKNSISLFSERFELERMNEIALKIYSTLGNGKSKE